MTDLKVQAVSKKFTKKVPTIRPGYLVRIHQKIKEGEKERVQIFEGLVIALNSGYGSNATVMVRKIVEGIGVEKVFPLHSPNVVKIEIKKTFGVRRAKLYYLRKSAGLSNRLRAKLGLTDEDTKFKKDDEEMVAAEVETAAPEASNVGADAVEASPELQVPSDTLPA